VMGSSKLQAILIWIIVKFLAKNLDTSKYQYFNCEVNDLQVRRKKKDIKTGLKYEFDVIAVGDKCKTVFLVEVKSSPRVEYINEFKNKKIDRFLKLFPEYEDYKLIPIFASLRLEDNIINYLTKNQIYAMVCREWEHMDLLNFEDIIQDKKLK
ncbi:hypothetical protein, partial [Hydrogenivirga sp. 128-5-R1-1]|uniref:hypothetical protein n=1 Tax=Hydrogenivirga sp. 128-5-R1-1 TaxID=392423 RepID=UPI00015F1F3C